MGSFDRKKLEWKFLVMREKKIRKARESFWEYCKLRAMDFYKPDRWHLWILCETLQALYEGELTRGHMEVVFNQKGNTGGKVDKRKKPPVTVPEDVRFKDLFRFGSGSEASDKLKINLPPRHGKSRTLILFCEWCFGKDNENRVITCSYNDNNATDFSRYTRDGISEGKTYSYEVVFSDIFPGTRIKQGDGSFKQWALEGQFFNYKGTGIGGAITGKGCNIGIIDDPTKNAEEAFNELALEKVWKWYTGTFLSRLEEGSKRIVNMTRWAKDDLCGKIEQGENARDWVTLKMEVRNKKGEMLCPELFSNKRYVEASQEMDEMIFAANYHQQPKDVQGVLYKVLKKYKPNDLPVNKESGEVEFEHIWAYGDTADEGKDYLCVIVFGVYGGEVYVLDVYYTKAGMEVTEPGTARLLYENKVQSAKIESNNGGRGFARNVGRLIWENHKSKKVGIRWFHQTKNKIARILSNSRYIMNHFYFPDNWRIRWPEFYKAIMNFQKEGGNKHDDAPDCLTGCAEMVDGGNKARAVDRL